MRTTRRLATTLTLLALLGACQTPEPETPTATIAAPSAAPTPSPTATAPPSPTPPPSPEDYAVPAVIDEAYIQRVLTALYDLESEVVRLAQASGGLSDPARDLLRAIYRPEQTSFQFSVYEEASAEGFPGLRPTPGNQGFAVQDLLSATTECIFVAGQRDFSEVLSAPSELEGLTYVQLLPRVAAEDPGARNATPWMVGGSERRPDGSVPEDPCA